MNIEPKNHPFAKDNCLTKPPLYIVFNVYFPGCNLFVGGVTFFGLLCISEGWWFPPRGVRTEFWPQRFMKKLSSRAGNYHAITLPETNIAPWKRDPWKFGDCYWKPPFLGLVLVKCWNLHLASLLVTILGWWFVTLSMAKWPPTFGELKGHGLNHLAITYQENGPTGGEISHLHTSTLQGVPNGW